MNDGEITWYGGGSLVEGKKFLDKRGFSEIVVRGDIKSFYVIEQDDPQVSVSSDSDKFRFSMFLPSILCYVLVYLT